MSMEGTAVSNKRPFPIANRLPTAVCPSGSSLHQHAILEEEDSDAKQFFRRTTHRP